MKSQGLDWNLAIAFISYLNLELSSCVSVHISVRQGWSVSKEHCDSELSQSGQWIYKICSGSRKRQLPHSVHVYMYIVIVSHRTQRAISSLYSFLPYSLFLKTQGTVSANTIAQKGQQTGSLQRECEKDSSQGFRMREQRRPGWQDAQKEQLKGKCPQRGGWQLCDQWVCLWESESNECQSTEALRVPAKSYAFPYPKPII